MKAWIVLDNDTRDYYIKLENGNSLAAVDEIELQELQREYYLTYLNIEGGRVTGNGDYTFIDNWLYHGRYIHDIIEAFNNKALMLRKQYKCTVLDGNVALVSTGDLPSVIPDWVNIVKRYTNTECKISAKSIKLGSNTYYVGKRTFQNELIDKLDLGENLMAMGKCAIDSCHNIKKLRFPKGFLTECPYTVYGGLFGLTSLEYLSVYTVEQLGWIIGNKWKESKTMCVRSPNIADFSDRNFKCVKIEHLIVNSELSKMPKETFENLMKCEIDNLEFRDMPKE